MKHAAGSTCGLNLIERTSYRKRHFQIPVTPHRYFNVLVSSRDRDCRTFYLSETELGQLRKPTIGCRSVFFSGVFNTMYNANEQTNYFMKQTPGLKYSDLRANFQEKLKSFPQQLHVV